MQKGRGTLELVPIRSVVSTLLFIIVFCSCYLCISVTWYIIHFIIYSLNVLGHGQKTLQK